MAGTSRREIEDTRVDLRRWSQQLLQLSAEVAERADELEGKDGGTNRSGQSEKPTGELDR